MNIYQKLIEVQKYAAEERIQKTEHNKFGGFSYYSIETLTAIFKESCIKHGLFAKIDTHIMTHRDPDPSHEKDGGHHYLTIFEIVNAENPEEKVTFRMASEPVRNKKMSAAQESGSNKTYNKRYVLMDILGVDDGMTDPDRINDGDPRPKKQNDTPQQKTKKPHDTDHTANYRKHFYKELKKTDLSFQQIDQMCRAEENYGKPADKLSVSQMKEVITALSGEYPDAGMEV